MGCLNSKESTTITLGRTARNYSEKQTTKKVDKHKHSKTSKTRGAEESEPPKLDEMGKMLREEVEKRRSYSDMQTTYFDTGGGKMIRLRYASCTQRGYYPDDPSKENQDALSITQNFAGEDGDIFFGVYDGHGPDGHDCARYAKEHLPALLSTHIRQERARLYNEQRKQNKTNAPYNPKLWPKLGAECYERASRKAHSDCSCNMIKELVPCVSLSGTTSISAGFHNGKITISNVGDSRAVLGYRLNNPRNRDECFNNDGDSKNKVKIRSPSQDQSLVEGKLVALPLSIDQTSWRKDERQRIRKAGGRVLTVDQLKGRKPIYEDDTDMTIDTQNSDNKSDFGDRIMGTNDDTIDLEGDPPRVWLPDDEIPGTAFTRSLGDHIAKTIGVIAEPEMHTKELKRLDTGGIDKVLVLASDGVFEFLTNQEVISMCDGVEDSSCAIDACRIIMDRSYEKWLEYENRTDDISVIVICMDTA